MVHLALDDGRGNPPSNTLKKTVHEALSRIIIYVTLAPALSRRPL